MLDGGHYNKTFLDKLKKEREKAKKAGGQKRRRPIPLLEFLRQVVVLTSKKCTVATCIVVSQIEASAMVLSKGYPADTLG
jgi:hypothetical protein